MIVGAGEGTGTYWTADIYKGEHITVVMIGTVVVYEIHE